MRVGQERGAMSLKGVILKAKPKHLVLNVQAHP
jgi:hypothetical protein